MRRMTRRDEGGAVAVIVAIMAVVLFGMAALVVDLGNARSERRAAQAAADASALAGGNVLFETSPTVPNYVDAEAAVKAYAARNRGVTAAEWGSCTDSAALATPSPSGTACISFEVTSTIARVRVKMPSRTVGTGFARAIGVNSIQVSALARSTLKRGGAAECGLCVLGSGVEHDIQNGDVTVHGADIHFNGDVSVSSNGLVATDGVITVEGDATGPLSNYDPNPDEGVAAITDPLADYFDKPNMSSLSVKSNPCLQGPGIYGDHTINGGTCALSPGLYVVTGLWKMGGSGGTISGSGVTIFFACGTPTSIHACASTGEAGGTIDTGGNGFLSIQAPTSGDYQGMALWFDRNNTAEAHLHGNGLGGFVGTVYGKSLELRMSGNGCTNFSALLIVGDLGMDGNPSCLNSTYTQGENVQIPPGDLHLDQ